MTGRDPDLPTPGDVLEAAQVLQGLVHRTPVFSSQSLNRELGAEVFFKAENFQKVGAFKFRGASFALAKSPPELFRNGVLSHSSGNHAQAVARAAAERGLRAVLVMPETSPQVKVDAVRGYGAEVIFCPDSQADRVRVAREVAVREGLGFLHPYDHPWVMAGQGTAALELMEEVPGLEVLIPPVGGGGLASGTCLAAQTRSTQERPLVFGAEPERADDAYRSLETGVLQPQVSPQTLADGLRTSLSWRTFEVLRQGLEGILLASEEGIQEGLRTLMERLKLVVEPSAAVPLAALRESRGKFRGKRIGIVLSGGNLDLGSLFDSLSSR